MNFQAVREANGNNVVINAIATVIVGTSYIPSGTAKQDCEFTDANGERQSITIWQGRGQPIPLEKQGQTLQINISCKQKGNRTNYGGFWNSNAQVASINPQQAAQAPQQAAQRPNAPQQAPRDARSTSIERQAVWKGACEYAGRAGKNPNELVEVAKAGRYFVETGENIYNVPNPDPSITNPNYVGDNPPSPTDDDIPF